MNMYLAALDSISALYLIVIIVGSFQVPIETIRFTRHFRFCLLSCLLGCIVEAASNVTDGHAGMNSLIIIFDFLSIILVDIVVFFYTSYLHALFSKKGPRHSRFTRILSILTIISLIINVIMCATGNMFTVVDGIFVPGAFFPYKTAISSIVFTGIIIYYVFNRVELGLKNIWLTLLFISIPTASVVISSIFSLQMKSCIFPVTAVSLFVVYVVIQSKIIIEADVNAQVLGRLSYYDTMTGLKNRRAYDDIIDELSDEDIISVVFCDANGLKSINDTQGHISGDNYIKKIAQIIRDAFPEGDVCRISGDEFVCIIKNIEDEVFAERIEDFKAVLASEGRIAAFGYETGKGCNFQDLVKSAEKKMYSDKQLYYIETGRDRRHY